MGKKNKSGEVNVSSGRRANKLQVPVTDSVMCQLSEAIQSNTNGGDDLKVF